MKNLNILIIDDNVHFSKAFQFKLMDSFENRINAIFTASNGIEGIKIIELGI